MPSEAEGASAPLGAMWLQQDVPRSTGGIGSRSVRANWLG